MGWEVCMYVCMYVHSSGGDVTSGAPWSARVCNACPSVRGRKGRRGKRKKEKEKIPMYDMCVDTIPYVHTSEPFPPLQPRACTGKELGQLAEARIGDPTAWGLGGGGSLVGWLAGWLAGCEEKSVCTPRPRARSQSPRWMMCRYLCMLYPKVHVPRERERERETPARFLVRAAWVA